MVSANAGNVTDNFSSDIKYVKSYYGLSLDVNRGTIFTVGVKSG